MEDKTIIVDGEEIVVFLEDDGERKLFCFYHKRCVNDIGRGSFGPPDNYEENPTLSGWKCHCGMEAPKALLAQMLIHRRMNGYG